MVLTVDESTETPLERAKREGRERDVLKAALDWYTAVEREGSDSKVPKEEAALFAAARALDNEWEDVDDEWTLAIKAAHPARSGSHDAYAMAMRMVGHRYSKGELVALVNWLLVRGTLLAEGKRAK